MFNYLISLRCLNELLYKNLIRQSNNYFFNKTKSTVKSLHEQLKYIVFEMIPNSGYRFYCKSEKKNYYIIIGLQNGNLLIANFGCFRNS